jgi:hypothetical protein
MEPVCRLVGTGWNLFVVDGRKHVGTREVDRFCVPWREGDDYGLMVATKK